MATGNFSARRLENIKRNKALLEDLGAAAQGQVVRDSAARFNGTVHRPAGQTRKRRRVEKPRATPSRTSARIAATPAKPDYSNDDEGLAQGSVVRSKKQQGKARAPAPSIKRKASDVDAVGGAQADPNTNPDDLLASWSSWTPSAPPPTRAEAGVFHFDSHPDFTPNKSPAEVLREGAFGGSYFRPLFSKKLGFTVADDCPFSLKAGLDASYYLDSPTYNPEANKFKVACGQSIEQWEANGWINHEFDVRGWFQWYCRFFAGRRCPDDDRQVSRWKKCVGSTGRWRRMLLKKYVSSGVRTVWDDGEDEDAPEVSPVMHQTCHHWAFEVTQDVLDEYWRTGR